MYVQWLPWCPAVWSALCGRRNWPGYSPEDSPPSSALRIHIHGCRPCVGLLSGYTSLLSSWVLTGVFAAAFLWHSWSLRHSVMCRPHPVCFMVGGQWVSWQEGDRLTWVPIPFLQFRRHRWVEGYDRGQTSGNMPLRVPLLQVEPLRTYTEGGWQWGLRRLLLR